MAGENSQDIAPDVRQDLTELDKHHLSSISSSISRARNLLLACSFIGAWVLANVLLELLLWQNIRTPAGQNIIHAMDSVLEDVELRVPAESLRACDRVDYLTARRFQESANDKKRVTRGCVTVLSSDSSLFVLPESDKQEQIVLVRYPVNELFEQKIDWCRRYRQFARGQCRTPRTTVPADAFTAALICDVTSETHPDMSVVRAIGMVLDRAEISESTLPKDIISRPQTSVPVVGLDVARDDIPIVGAILLILGMIWFRFALDAVRENILEVKDRFGGNADRMGFLKSFLSLQFMFIRKNRENARNRAVLNTHFFVYCLFFVPYVVILFTLAADVYDIIWQVGAYSHLSKSQLIVPFQVSSGFLLKDETGILAIRWAVLFGAVILLARLAWRSWEAMHLIRSDLDWNGAATEAEDHSRRRGVRLPRRSAFLLITAVPVFVMTVWTLARVIGARSSIDTYGWSYGLTLWGALAVAGAVFVSVALVQWVWPEMESARIGEDTETN